MVLLESEQSAAVPRSAAAEEIFSSEALVMDFQLKALSQLQFLVFLPNSSFALYVQAGQPFLLHRRMPHP